MAGRTAGYPAFVGLSLATLAGALMLPAAEVSAESTARIVVVIGALLAAGDGLAVLLRVSFPEPAARLVVSFALGTIAMTATVVLLSPVVASPLLLALWIALGTAGVLAVRRARAGHRSERVAWPTLGSLAVVQTVGLLPVVEFWRRHPLEVRGWFRYSSDVPFFEALSRSVILHGPGDSVLAAGVPIRYHWLSYGWAGSVGHILDLAPYVATTRVLVAAAILTASLGTYAVARRVGGRMSDGVLAATVMVVAVPFGLHEFLTSQAPVLSPSQAFSTLWMMAALVVLINTCERPVTLRSAWRESLGLAVLVAAATAGKTSHGLVLAAGAALATVVILVRRARHQPDPDRVRARMGTVRPFLIVLLAAATAFLLFIFDFEQPGGGVSLVAGPGPIVWRAVHILAAASIGFGAVLFSARSTNRSWMLVPAGSLLGGALVALPTRVGGASELYFLMSGVAAATPFAAVQIGHVIRRIRTVGASKATSTGLAILVAGGLMVVGTLAIGPIAPWPWGWSTAPGVWALSAIVGAVLARRTGAAAGAVGIAAVVLLTGALITGTLLRAQEFAGLFTEVQHEEMSSAATGPREPSDPFAISDDHFRAATLIRATTPVDAIIATDRICARVDARPPCDTRSFTVGALTGRRLLLEGYNYGPLRDADEISRRIATIDAFLQDPSPSTFRGIRESGVTWLWLEGRHDVGVRGFGSVRFESAAVTLIELAR